MMKLLPTVPKEHGSRQTLYFVYTASLLCILMIPQADAVGCFVCSSINGNEPQCEDTFNNTGKFYDPDCSAGRKDRNGLFPATACIKMKAGRAEGPTVVVRTCVVDNGGLNSDTEIGRIHHCGLVDQIVYNETVLYGCILPCRTDGCNGATYVSTSASLFISAVTLSSIVHYASKER